MTSINRLVTAALVAAACACSPASAQGDSNKTLQTLFDEYWAWDSREFPEIATARGDDRYNDRVTDLSQAAIDRRKAYRADLLARLRKVDVASISGQDRVSRDVLVVTLENDVRVGAFHDEWMPVSQTTGPQLNFAFVAKSTPFRNVADYENYLKRMHGLSVQVGQTQALMARGIATGWVWPAAAIARVPSQIDAWLTKDLELNPAYRPFMAFPRDMPAATQGRLANEGRRAVAEEVVPAFRALKTFVEKTYLPAARRDLSVSTLPGGAAYYDALIAQRTTTALSAKEIHAIGLSEVERISKKMDATMRATGFAGSRGDFIRLLHDDPRFYYTRAEDALAGYRDIAKRADAELPKLFAVLPRLPYGIRAMEAFEGDSAEHYSSGSAENGLAGYFDANTNDLRTRPKYNMETVLLHEAVPGHHLQVARAQELTGLPEFRKHAFFVAYVEGWALYAESLGEEMGFYTDPYSMYGHLSWEMVRACRLVIDTGIHAFGWTRERAIAYLGENAGLNEAFATAETDRYIVNAGQALGYKLGELKIKALRAKAASALGQRFDLRRFHNALIDDGQLPLPVLEQRVDAWIAAEKHA
jgi:uncharacterized protein (DUF885 family)